MEKCTENMPYFQTIDTHTNVMQHFPGEKVCIILCKYNNWPLIKVTQTENINTNNTTEKLKNWYLLSFK
jgi:hypothetical protein